MENHMSLLPVLAARPPVWAIVMIIIIVLLIAGIVALSIYGRKLQKQQEESQKQLQEASQRMRLLVIDKKRMKMKEAGLPSIVMEQVPKYMRGRKIPVVKAKVLGGRTVTGQQIMTFISEEKIYDIIPVKKEVRAVISGMYIMDVKAVRGTLEEPPKKKSFGAKLRDRADKNQQKLKEAQAKQLGKKK